MKKLILIFTLFTSTVFADASNTSYLCYSTCTFDGYQNALSRCNEAAEAFNTGGNDSVVMNAVCYKDDGQSCGESGPLCTFPKIVMRKTVRILQ